MRVVRIVGAPASGKTTLRLALAAGLALPSFAIDDERRAILAPGEAWPASDQVAWLNLRARLEAHHPCIVETSGLSPSDAWLYRDTERLTILCFADADVRRARLVARVRSGDLLARGPNYVKRVSRLGDPVGVSVDALWCGDRPADVGPLLGIVAAWLPAVPA